MTAERATDRRVLRLTGADRQKFLKNLVTRDPEPGGIAYAALLTPQGKFLADFFLVDRGAEMLIDVAEVFAAGLAQRLTLYKLRADVTVEATDIPVARGLGEPPEGAHADPRHPDLGWRAYGVEGDTPQIDWDAIRVARCIPESGIELIANDSYILEAGFDRLQGVDHRKGCYVGQEVTARMKHKTELRKGLVTVGIEGVAEIGTPILSEGRAAGTLYTRSGDRAIAYLRYDRAAPEMTAGAARITWDETVPA